MNDSMFIFLPHLKSKEDLANRLNSLLNDIFIRGDKISPDNMLADGEYEYECYGGDVNNMEEVCELIYKDRTAYHDLVD